MRLYVRAVPLMLLLSTAMLAVAGSYEDDQQRAEALMAQCVPGKALQSDECLEGGRLWDATSARLHRDIAASLQQQEQARERAQQDEQWREQVRRSQ
ncbi:hypothetical protein ACNFIA_03160 [Pseudomonas sp. NY15437]|uniref:hypothetical protein n=1 Tax=Pseudomonas sp. NY15437 TaxID=3400360 RepID=UPI003A866AAA